MSGFLVRNVKFGVIEFRREQRNGRLVWKVSDQVLDDRLDDMMIKQRQGTETRRMENSSLFSNLNSELVVVLWKEEQENMLIWKCKNVNKSLSLWGQFATCWKPWESYYRVPCIPERKVKMTPLRKWIISLQINSQNIQSHIKFLNFCSSVM